MTAQSFIQTQPDFSASPQLCWPEQSADANTATFAFWFHLMLLTAGHWEEGGEADVLQAEQ